MTTNPTTYEHDWLVSNGWILDGQRHGGTWYFTATDGQRIITASGVFRAHAVGEIYRKARYENG